MVSNTYAQRDRDQKDKGTRCIFAILCVYVTAFDRTTLTAQSHIYVYTRTNTHTRTYTHAGEDRLALHRCTNTYMHTNIHLYIIQHVITTRHTLEHQSANTHAKKDQLAAHMYMHT